MGPPTRHMAQLKYLMRGTELSYKDQVPTKSQNTIVEQNNNRFMYLLLPWSTSVPYILVASFLPLKLCAVKVRMTNLLLALPLKGPKGL